MKMKAIYEPKGAALEYSPLAVNLYEGCNHGCVYCYVPGCRRIKRETFNAEQHVRKDILHKIECDLNLMQLEKDNRRTMLCFTCDPYERDSEFNIITRNALELFRKYDRPFQVLSKGGMKASRDFDLYGNNDAYAATLTFSDDVTSLKYEPGAAIPEERIKSLKTAKEAGIETWASFEPVIRTKDAFELIDRTYEFTDLYKIGKINHFKTATPTDWKQFTLDIIDVLEKRGKQYYIKDSLKKFL